MPVITKIKPYYKSKCPSDMKLKEERLLNYLKRKFTYKRKTIKGKDLLKRPMLLKYLHISKATGLTYDQVRYGIGNLVKSGIIEKWYKYPAPNKIECYYRLRLE